MTQAQPVQMSIDASLGLLGVRVRDMVTGQTGVVTSVCFDLYGCIQAIVTPPAKDGKIEYGSWLDVKRLERLEPGPVMAPPVFAWIEAGEESGPELKPSPGAQQPVPRSL